MATVEPAALPGSFSSSSSSGSFGFSKGALGLSAAGGVLDILGGLFGLFGAGDAADIAESQARLFRLEAEADATRFAEQAERFKSEQAVRFLKSGVKLTGSPLDILAETARVSAENISAIRTRGAREALNLEQRGEKIRAGGRTAFVRGIAGGTFKVAKGIFEFQAVTGLGRPRNITNPKKSNG